MKIIIHSGGIGSRLWPLSTKQKPKQYHSFSEENSLLRNSFLRIKEFGVENIFIATLEEHKHFVYQDIPELDQSHVLTQAAPHDSALGTALVIEKLKNITGIENETLVFLPSDHIIEPANTFCEFLRNAETINQQHPTELITVGISPTYPANGFGYIQQSPEVFAQTDTIKAFRVKRFLEKPDTQTAQKLIDNGNVSWNAGFIIGTHQRLLQAFQHHAPQYLEAVHNLDIFEKLPRASFDYVIWENEKNILCLPSNHLFEWNDVGMWDTIPHLSKGQNTTCLNNNGKEISLETSENIIFSSTQKKVLTLGLENIVIIESEDGILVANKENLSDIKKGLKILNV